jgi:hypothetical protein
MRVIRVVSAALLGVSALTFSAPAAFASGGDSSYGSGDSRSYGSGDDRSDEGGGRGEDRSDRGGDDYGSRGGGGGEDRSDDGGEDRGGRDDGGRSEHYRHGVRAGEGGTVAGFDLKEVGMGAALIAGSVGAAYYLSRRRSVEEGVA